MNERNIRIAKLCGYPAIILLIIQSAYYLGACNDQYKDHSNPIIQCSDCATMNSKNEGKVCTYEQVASGLEVLCDCWTDHYCATSSIPVRLLIYDKTGLCTYGFCVSVTSTGTIKDKKYTVGGDCGN